MLMRMRIGSRIELISTTKNNGLIRGDTGTVVFEQLGVFFVEWDCSYTTGKGIFRSALSGEDKWKNTDILFKNVMQCDYCGGAVHRYEHMFQCEDCYSIADLMMGMMSPSRAYNTISKLKNNITRISVRDINTDVIKVIIKITKRQIITAMQDVHALRKFWIVIATPNRPNRWEEE
jgi:hypothetical protein